MDECDDPDAREKYSKLILPIVCPHCRAQLKFSLPKNPEKKNPKKISYPGAMIAMGICILPVFIILLVITHHFGIDLISMLGIPLLAIILLLIDIIAAVYVVRTST